MLERCFSWLLPIKYIFLTSSMSSFIISRSFVRVIKFFFSVFSFENDDGSKVSQEGEHKIVDEEHAVESIKGSYSYNDVNGVPIHLTYTADENGFRPVGAHLPTPPPVPLEILRSLRYLATAQPWVDEQVYDYQPSLDEQLYAYKPSKKVFRGRQYNNGVVTRSRNNLRSNTFSETLTDNSSSENKGAVARSRNNLRSNTFPETLTDNTPSENKGVVSRSRNNLRSNTAPETLTDNSPSEVLVKSADDQQDTKTDTTSETTPDASTLETTSESGNTEKPTQTELLNDAKDKIIVALKESIEKTSKLTQTATKETQSAALATIREEASKLVDVVKTHVANVTNKASETSGNIAKEVSAQAKESREVIDENLKIVSDAVSDAVSEAEAEPQIDLNLRLIP